MSEKFLSCGSSKKIMGLLAGLVILFVLSAPVGAQTLTVSSTPSPVATTDPNANFGLSPEEEAKILKTIDAQEGITNPSGANLNRVVYTPPPSPTGLAVIALKEGVYLSWNSSPPGSTTAYYNVYRSNSPGTGYHQVNTKPLNAAYFLDGPLGSADPPQNGEDYFYVVAAADGQGNISAYSDEASVETNGMEVAQSAEQLKAIRLSKQTATEEEKTLSVPEQNVINLKLPADSQLSIQGYKKVDAQFAFQNYNQRPVANGISNQVNTTTINQELVVNLKGKVGKNVDVNVDYSDVNRAGGTDQTKQDISIVYHGDADSAVQQVSFGDLQLTLPNTEFAGFSKQLFGLEAILKFDNFRFTSFFAQTKGIAATKVFTGNTTQIDKTYTDISYIQLKYFYISRPPVNAPNTNYLPKNTSEQIWVNTPGNLAPANSNNFVGQWEHWLPGRDYTIDYSTGIITFVRALSISAQVAVGYDDQLSNHHGLNVFGNTPAQLNPILGSNAPVSVLGVPDSGIIDTNNGTPSGALYILIKDNGFKDNSSQSAIVVSPMYLVNYFALGTDKIIPPQQDPGFLFQIVSQGSNDTIQTGQGGTAATPYVYTLNLDLNVMSVTNVNFAGPPTGPPAYFPERPFANQDGNASPVTAAGVLGQNDVYNTQQNEIPASLFYIHLRYKTQLNAFKLDNINILRGSETVYLDGRLMRRDADYFIDYTSGFIDFQDKSILTPSSQIIVSYEYSPFGSFGAENILGGRMEYDVTDKFFVGSTFLMNTSQQPNDTPQLGSTPNSLTLFDADAKYEMDSEDLQGVTGTIPGLEKWRPPATLKLSGEIAQSYFNPDTYNAQGETGVAIVDNMEGIDSAITASLNQTSWLVSSAPNAVLALGSQTYDSAADVNNNRVRFYDDQVSPNIDFGVNTVTSLPGGGGHIYAVTNKSSDVVNVLDIPYAHLSSKTWAGVRQVLSTVGEDFSSVQFFQAWIYNDGKPKWMMFDFGVINESTNGDPLLDSDLPTNQAHPNLAYGIPTFYSLGTPFYFGAPPANTGVDASGATGFIGLPGEVSQEGQNNGAFVTQNMDGTGILNPSDSYYEYGVQVNWTGWQLVKIPVNLTATTDVSSTTSNGIPYFYHDQNTASPINVRTLRMWMTGTNTTPIDGLVVTDSISFTHNLWQLQVDPGANANMGVTVNSSKFDVNSISQAQNASYQANMRFIIIQPGQDQSAIQFNEKSLDITYKLSSADYNPPGNINGSPIYYATRVFQQGLDFTDFQELRMDLQIRSYNPGDILFVRIGNDQQNYYQYNIPLTSVASICVDTWGTVVIPIGGGAGNRLKVGTPFINRATQVSFGVLSPNPPGGQQGELWIDNLRTDSPNVRTGTARRLNAEMTLGEDPKKPFATIDGRYREVDSGFTEIDQTSTHFQHSLQYGLDYSSSGLILFAQPLQTQLSFTDQQLYTETNLKDNPYYINLPNSQIDTFTGSLRYTKDLGADLGRLTSVNFSTNLSSEKDVYEPDYLDQPGVQGNTTKGEDKFSLISTYDMPAKIWFMPIGTNQLTESYSLTIDRQNFDFDFLAPYNRTTYQQTYGWTNTTEVVKNLVFTPGFNVSLTDAVGNTNSPGVPGTVATPIPFVDQFQPKAGVVYRGIPGVVPSVTYTGSNQYDYVDYPDGPRFIDSNNINYSVNVTPGSWFDFFQKLNLTLFGGRTDSSTASIPNYGNANNSLSFEQQWGITSPSDPNIYNIAILATKSETDQLNASFKLFDVWDFRPTGSWTDQYSLLYKGAPPTRQVSDTLGLTTIYNKRIFTIPWVEFSINSAQLQYTRTDSTQYDSSTQYLADGTQTNIDSQTHSDIYGVTFPYEINKFAQGNIHYQDTLGYQNGLSTTNVPTDTYDSQFSMEYDQKIAPNLILHIPFTHWRIQLHDAIELKANFLREWAENDSSYTFNQVKTERYRGTLELDYNALKNLRIGLTGINEYYTDYLTSTLSYVLWQVNISGEAKF